MYYFPNFEGVTLKFRDKQGSYGAKIFSLSILTILGILLIWGLTTLAQNEAQITVIKHVQNDFGGNGVASDFKIHVIGNGVSNP